MLRRHIKKRLGFTIPEILIAILVITIALLGTIAAIAYGLRASKLGSDNTVAIQINRKVYELMLQSIFPPTDANFAAVINHGPADPSLPRIATPSVSNPWQPVFVADTVTTPKWFKLADYGFVAGTPEAEKFILETSRFQLDISSQGPLPFSGVEDPLWVTKRFQTLVIQTRWQDKNATGWKVVRTEGYGLQQ